MHVLIIKMSSMGDIIHTLPAVSDAVKAFPNIQFDWVAEEAFVEIPAWHSHVCRVIPIALRRWRKQPWLTLKQGEIQQFYQQLRLNNYDRVIDAQGSIKSAVTTRLSRGYHLGMDKHSIREKFADWAYQKKFFVPRAQHAIDRSRQLFAQALEYPLPKTAPNCGILKERLNLLPKLCIPENYVIFVPNASWFAKCWPEKSWSLLLEKMADQQISVYIPWGNQSEKERAVRLKDNYQHVNVLPFLSLSEIAILFSHAKAAVCVDTGLSHLAAGLGTPTITLYGPTDPKLIGTIGSSQIHLQSKFSLKTNLLEIPVEKVWQTFKSLIKVNNKHLN